MVNKYFDIPARLRNPWFWIGIIGLMMTSVGMTPEMFTDWTAVLTAIQGVLSSPLQLGTVIVTVLSIFIDPSTEGLTDKRK